VNVFLGRPQNFNIDAGRMSFWATQVILERERLRAKPLDPRRSQLLHRTR
jgi:hypothetical protein